MPRWFRFLIALIFLFLLIQVIPYGRRHNNPPVVKEPVWDSPETKVYFDNSCADCHSNRTIWPWYSSIAPISWVIQHHVDEGRQKLNLSALGHQKNDISEMADLIWERSMPPQDYLLMHPKAVRESKDLQAFIRGLERTFADPQNSP